MIEQAVTLVPTDAAEGAAKVYWMNSCAGVEMWCRCCDVFSASKGPRTRPRCNMRKYNVVTDFKGNVAG